MSELEILLVRHAESVVPTLGGLGAPVDQEFWLAMPMPAVYRLVVSPIDGWRSVRGPGLSVRLRGAVAPERMSAQAERGTDA